MGFDPTPRDRHAELVQPSVSVECQKASQVGAILIFFLKLCGPFRSINSLDALHFGLRYLSPTERCRNFFAEQASEQI